MVKQVCNEFIWSLDKLEWYRVDRKHVCMCRVYGVMNICIIEVWNDVAVLKSLWALAYKKIRIRIKWVYDYYIKRANIMHYMIPSLASWMLARNIDNMRHVIYWNELNQWVENGKYFIKGFTWIRSPLSLSLFGGHFGVITNGGSCTRGASSCVFSCSVSLASFFC